ERRIENLVNPELSGLPAFLAPTEGLHSGYMMGQVTAASLVYENKVMAHPASVDSIPTSANKEDHVSMGTIAALKAARILRNAEYVISIEFLCAAQGLEYRGEQKPGTGVEVAYQTFRRTVPPLQEDRLFYKDLEKARKLLRSRKILEAVESKVGAIK
ncbi:MAG: aromatic amino acid lyase, partial [Planctomycetes bacterium]|nr:aromatic amino acid lyase [Planctomycetota bacterium]